MPSKTKKQARFMAAIAHSRKFAKKAGVPQSVGREFHQADKRKRRRQAKDETMSKFAQDAPSYAQTDISKHHGDMAAAHLEMYTRHRDASNATHVQGSHPDIRASTAHHKAAKAHLDAGMVHAKASSRLFHGADSPDILRKGNPGFLQSHARGLTVRAKMASSKAGGFHPNNQPNPKLTKGLL